MFEENLKVKEKYIYLDGIVRTWLIGCGFLIVYDIVIRPGKSHAMADRLA